MLPVSAEVVIIGGGVHGCSIAYHLASKGMHGVVVLEQKYLTYGGTGRSAAGIRQQFGTEINCRLAKENIKGFIRMKEELDTDFDLELEQGGYMWLAYTEGQLNQLRENVRLQSSLGIPSKILNPDEIKELIPLLDVEGVLGASWCAEDGHVNPHRVTFAYYEAAKRLGVKFYTYTKVVDIEIEKDKVKAVVTDKGKISTRKVVNAAGPWGKEIGKMVGLDIPVVSERHQIMVTEPVNRIIKPLILCQDDGSYWKQEPTGGFLIGMDNPNEKKGYDVGVTWQFMEEVSRRVLKKMPILRDVRVVRQWSGPYDITPDSQSIVGPVEEVEGFYLDVGWSGHGLQFAPSIGRIMSELIIGEEPFISVDVLSFNRFKTGKLIPEPACI
ncbi:MAG: FAD-binding oxidoreductase [Synergistetes bacterium]|nr:FAD-binding oxidoreductase [Synergistota bacterium]